jgi:single-strand DNA-binding protein
MRGVNKVILVGRATRDTELHQTTTGKPVSNIRLATNRMVQGQEEPQYHTVICWDRLAETTAHYVKKGKAIYAEGRLQYRSYIGSDGVEQRTVEIVAEQVQFLDRAGGPGRDSAESSQPTGSAEEIKPEDIPF